MHRPAVNPDVPYVALSSSVDAVDGGRQKFIDCVEQATIYGRRQFDLARRTTPSCHCSEQAAYVMLVTARHAIYRAALWSAMSARSYGDWKMETLGTHYKLRNSQPQTTQGMLGRMLTSSGESRQLSTCALKNPAGPLGPTGCCEKNAPGNCGPVH